MKKLLMSATALVLITACSGQVSVSKDTEAKGPATMDDAAAFVKKAEADFRDMNEYASHVFWMQANFINHDTNWLAARAGAESTELGVKYANGTKRFKDLPLTGELARKMKMIKLGLTLPAPSKDGAAKELSDITTFLDSAYSSATIDLDG